MKATNGATQRSASILEPRNTPKANGVATDRASRELAADERQHLHEALGGLTARERDVVEAIWAGGSNEHVAERMCVAIPTLRTHLMRIHRKLGTQGKGDLIRYIAEHMLDGYRTGALAPVRARVDV